MKNRRVKLIVVLVMLLPMVLFARGTGEKTGSIGATVVASSSWVGSIAKAAGAKNVVVLAPIDEYNFSPQDSIAASKADYIVWAGYEEFMRTLIGATDIDENNVFEVNTNNAPDILLQTVQELAAKLGTSEESEKWTKELQELSVQALENAKEQNLHQKKAAVHYYQAPLAHYLGYDVVYVFGPQELTANDVLTVESYRPEVIIDNWHSIQGKVFDCLNRQYVQLINFPGPFRTASIVDVLKYNLKQLHVIR